MEIVGRGFLARHLEQLADDHADVVAFAAGVSSTRDVSADSFERETRLLHHSLQRCRDSGRTLLFFSSASAAVYGARQPGMETDPVAPNSPYGAHKLALERLVVESGTDHLVLRMSHLVGSDQRDHQLFPTLLAAVRQGHVEIQRWATRDVLAVKDAVRLIDALLGNQVRNRVVNLASGYAVSVAYLVDWLAHRLGTTPERTYRDTGSSHLVSIELLRSLVPVDGLVDFGPHYYRDALDQALAGERVR